MAQLQQLSGFNFGCRRNDVLQMQMLCNSCQTPAETYRGNTTELHNEIHHKPNKSNHSNFKPNRSKTVNILWDDES